MFYVFLKWNNLGFSKGLLVLPYIMLETSKMTKTRKTLLIAFLLLSFILVGVGSYAKAEHWNHTDCCSFVLAGLIFGIGALVIAMWRPKLK